MHLARRKRRPPLAQLRRMTLLAFVLPSVVAPAALNILEDAEPILSDDQVDVLGRGHASDGVDQEGISARIGGDAASAAEHVQTDAHVLRPDQLDYMVHLLRPFVWSGDGGRSVRRINVRDEY